MSISTQQAGAGISGGLGGYAALASLGGMAGPVGAVLGLAAGFMSSGKDKSYRTYRAQEFRQNQRLKLQAALQTKRGGMAASASRLAASGGNVSGNIVQQAETAALIQAAIERATTMSNVSYEWQKGSGRWRGTDEVGRATGVRREQQRQKYLAARVKGR